MSETGGLNAATFVEPELVTWKSFDGSEISGFLYRPPAEVPRQASGRRRHPRRPRGAGAARLPGARQLPRSTSSASRSSMPNVRGSTGYGKTFLEARQRLPARGLLQGHRRALRLDRHAARPRRGPDHGAGRQLRRPHDAGRRDLLQRPHPLRRRRRRPLEPRHVPREHVRIPPGPAPRRVRRRARSEDARLPGEDRAAEQRREDQEAALRDPGLQRSARAADRVGADGRAHPQGTARPSGT